MCKILYCGDCYRNVHNTKNRKRHTNTSIEEYLDTPELQEKDHFYVPDKDYNKTRNKVKVSHLIIQKTKWKLVKELKI